MNYIDYARKLNTHENYLDILNKTEPMCKYIEIVVLDERDEFDNEVIKEFKNDIEAVSIVSEWWGTITFCENKLVRIKSSKKLFEFLAKYETFFKSNMEYNPNIGVYEDKSEYTDFGTDDIAFYDENNNILLYTTTHECFISVSEDIIKS